MKKHENIEKYSAKVSPDLERIVLFYKLVSSYVPQRKDKDENYSFWNKLGDYIQEIRSTDDRYYGRQIPTMIELLRKGMVQTYEN